MNKVFIGILLVVAIALAGFVYANGDSSEDAIAIPPLDCYSEGQTIPVISDPLSCCPGLDLIRPPNSMVGISGYCTAKCGDAICGTIETAYNCPEDCESLDSCGDGICQNITCASIGCPVPESPDNCPEDCPAERECIESDNGLDYYVSGTVNPCPSGPPCGAWVDQCLDNGTTLLEYSCDNLDGVRYDCPNGCRDGACVVDGCPDVYEPVCGIDEVTYSNSCEAKRKGVNIAYEGKCKEPYVCPAVYAPVCGVDGKTYSNKCVASSNNVRVAYSGECGPDKIKAELGKNFELKENQVAMLLDNTGAYINVDVQLHRINYYQRGMPCEPGRECDPVSKSVQVSITSHQSNGSGSSVFYLSEGESAKVSGVTLEVLKIGENSASFAASKETPPDSIKVKLGERFKLSRSQTALVLKTGRDVMKVNFDHVTGATICGGNYEVETTEVIRAQAPTGQGSYAGSTSYGSSTTAQVTSVTNTSIVEPSPGPSGGSIPSDEPGSGGPVGGGYGCGSRLYSTFHISLASGGGTHYVTLTEGQSRVIGKYRISMKELIIRESYPPQYVADLVVEEISQPTTKIVYLDKPFDLQAKEKAIVRETRLQLRMLNLYEDVAVLEILQPITTTPPSGSGPYGGSGGSGPAVTATDATVARASGEEEVEVDEAIEEQIVESVESSVSQGSIAYRPYIKLRAGEEITVYGHEVKLNFITAITCVAPGPGCGALSANIVVSKKTEPEMKKVFLNERFDLVEDQTAVVLDVTPEMSRTPNEAMRVKLLDIMRPKCVASNTEAVKCDTRPYARVSVQMPTEDCTYGSSCVSSQTVIVLREGQERLVSGFRLRLLDIAGNKTWFVVKRQDILQNLIKVRLDEKFKLGESRTALVVEENVYIKLEGIAVVKCREDESKCIRGSYADLTVWKALKYGEESPTRQRYRLRTGESLKLYGLRIFMPELSGDNAVFVVSKPGSSVVNVHVDDPFKLSVKQAARVLEANMRIDLLGIGAVSCPENVECESLPSQVEINVSNYRFSREMTGKEVVATDYVDEVVEQIVSSGISSVTMPNVELPPTPFNTYILSVGESVEVNDFVIKVLSIGYEHAEFIVTKKGSGQKFHLEIKNGWNLFSIPGELDMVESGNCDSRDVRVFEYIEEEKRFEESPDGKAGQAYWLYNPGNACEAKGTVREAVKMAELDLLVNGWNFVAVTTDMIGSNISEITGECAPRAAFFYNAASKKWQKSLDHKIGANDLGKAFALYATKECSLGGLVPPMPPIGG